MQIGAFHTSSRPAASAVSAASAVDGVRASGSRDLALARRDVAASLEALNRIYNGIDPQSPARQLNHGAPVALGIPRDLNGAFRTFLTNPALPHDHFHGDDPQARPNAHGALTAGKSVTYSMHEVPHTRDGKRHVVVTVGGLTSGDIANGSTPGRGWNNRGRLPAQGAEIARVALGIDGEMSQFGRALGRFFLAAQRKDPSLVMSFDGHSLGAEAAAKAFQTVTESGRRAKVNLFNPGPVSGPDDPAAFAAGVARAGGQRAFRQLGATFRSDKDPVEIVQHLPGAAQVLALSGADWDTSRVLTPYQYVDSEASGLQHHNHPAANVVHGFNRPNTLSPGASAPIGMAYLEQVANANRMIAR